MRESKRQSFVTSLLTTKASSSHPRLQIAVARMEIWLNLVLIHILVLLPISVAGSEDNMAVVPAQEILDKIEMGLTVEYDHVIIKGDLDLSKLDLLKRPVGRTSFETEELNLSKNLMLISSFIGLNDSIIDGNVYFSNAIFDNTVCFKSSVFNGDAGFSNSVFNGDVDFRRSEFNRVVYFWGLEFNGDADFRDSEFNGDANFKDSKYNGDANFRRSEFNRVVYFWGLEFNGDADFDNSKFNDFANFWGVTIDGIISSSGLEFNGDANFHGSEFSNQTTFWGLKFNGIADFSDSEFNGYADFRGSKFNRSASFVDSKFMRNSRFDDLVFNGYADFSGSVFNGFTNFGGVEFERNFHINGLVFNSDADFSDSVFNGTTYLVLLKFNGDADFSRSLFKGSTSFVGLDLNSEIRFRGSKFNGYAYLGDARLKRADFTDSEFNGRAEFGDSVFNDTAFFSDTRFNGNALFRGLVFNDHAYFDNSSFNISDFIEDEFNKLTIFDDARFDNSTSFNGSWFKEDALFEGTVFNGTLYLTRTKYERLYIRWKNINNLGYDDAAYLSLLENFKKLGYLEDYDGCYYEYRRAHRDQSWGGMYNSMNPAEEWLRKHIDVGLEVFYGYGKKPIWPLLWSALVILIFGLFWQNGGLKRDNDGNQRGILERYGPGDHSCKHQRCDWRDGLTAASNAIVFSATVFLSGTRLFVDPPQLPQMKRWSESQAKAAFIFERVLGALFSILFFLAISGTVVR
jgi:hypothetical protein